MACDYCGKAAPKLHDVAPRWSTPTFRHVCDSCRDKLQAVIDDEYEAIEPRVKARIFADTHTHTQPRRGLAQIIWDLIS